MCIRDRFSGDLTNWFTDVAHVVLVERFRDASGAVVETWRAAQPMSAESKQFLRARAELQ